MEPQTPTPEWRNSSITPRPTQRFFHSLYYLLLTDGGESECYEALDVDTRTKWEHVKDEEMKSLIINLTWDLIPLPAGKKALDNKWVYRLKEEHDESKLYKARLVMNPLHFVCTK